MATSGNNRDKKRDKKRVGSIDDDWPQSVEEAVDRILQGMSDEEKHLVRATPRDDLILFHHGWGAGIRNSFGLWNGNRALMRSCAMARGGGPGSSIMYPDDASLVIMEAVWERLQEEQ